MPRYDARQLVDNIERLIAGTPLSSIPSPFLYAPEPEPVEGEFEVEDVEGPLEAGDLEGRTSTMRALGLSIFPALRQHQQVDKVPEGARFAFLKKMLMRVLRMVSGPQAAFNYFVFSALEVVAQHTDALRRRLLSLDGAYRKAKAETDVKLAGLHQAVEVAYRKTKAETDVKVAGLHQAIEVLETRMSEDLQGLRAAVNMTLDQMTADFHQRIQQAQEAAVQTTVQTAVQSSRDMVESVWKGLEERDEQLLNTTRGVQSCHVQISKLEHDAREAQARLLVLNEQINIQLDVFEKMRQRLEERRPEELRAAGVEVPGPLALRGGPSTEKPATAAAPSPVPRKMEPALEPAPLALTATPVLGPAEPPIPSLEFHQIDLFYLRFQRQFRGDEAMLRERQQQYVDLLLERAGRGDGTGGAPRRLLDLACGDGVFLDLWRDRAGWEVHGVDLSAAMARLGHGSGVSIEQADAFAYLESGPEKAWDVITSFQFIEHLEKAELTRLLRDCKRALRPGGLLLFETLNPHSLISHKWFHLDLTHKRLIFPEVAGLLLESLGMRVLETQAISEVHESEKLQLLGDARLQANFDRLNEFLFGKQDYYVLAQRP